MTAPLIFSSAATSILRAPKCPQSAPVHYRAIHDEARRVGWPASFAADLTTWDRLALTGAAVCHETGAKLQRLNPIATCEPFGYVLREGGSHLLPIVGYSPRETGTAAMVVHSFGADSCRFYGWDGVALQSFTCAANLDTWIAEMRERVAGVHRDTLCFRDGCGARWTMIAKRYGAERVDRRCCENHVPAGSACTDCGDWMDPPYRFERRTICHACEARRLKRTQREARRAARKEGGA